MITFAGVSYKYPRVDPATRSLKLSLLAAIRGKGIRTKKEVVAVDDISFEVKRGDRVALIGPNGSGKSTILRLAANIYRPTKGTIETSSSKHAILSASTGINQVFSGRENCRVPLMLAGLSAGEVAAAIPRIEDFVDIGEFFDKPVYTYSDGMRARLCFAISAETKAHLLIMDEWLSAGDVAFVEKAAMKLQDLSKSVHGLLVASHSLDVTRRLCNVGIYVRNGKIEFQGSIDSAIERYMDDYHRERIKELVI